MTKEEITSFIQKTKELPALIDFYSRFRKKIADPNTSAGEIADIISSDQGITAKVLRIANSPFYGLMNRITTVAHAIVVIGFNGIHYIVLNMSVLAMFDPKNKPIAGFDIKQLWQHSASTAQIAKIAAKKTRYPAVEEMSTAGLLHDIGKVFIFRYFPTEFEKIIALAKEKNMLFRDTEEQVIGLTHTEIGELLLKEWNLPETLIATTANHHNPLIAKDRAKACAIVHFSDILCRALELGSGGDERIPPLISDAYNLLGLEQSHINEIVDEFMRDADTSYLFDGAA